MKNGSMLGILAGLFVTMIVLLLVNGMPPVSTANLAQEVGAQDRDAKIADAITKTFAEVAPLVPAEEIVTCVDTGMDQPGIIVGRFCRRYGSKNVNLRVTQAIPVAALRLLPKMSEIEAMGSQWDSLGPLVEFSGLTWLDLGGSTIGDFTSLADMPQLETLGLKNTNFTDLSLIAGLSKLTILTLGGLPISDVSALESFTHMEALYLNDTDVVDLTPLSGMKDLRILDLRNTAVQDLSPLDGIVGLKIWR